MKISHIFLGLLVHGAIAVPAASSHAIHEQRDPLDSKWVKGAQVSPNTNIPVRIALKQANAHKGEEYLLEVSDPTSPKYGQHYTAAQVVDLFAASEQTVKSVKEWLVASGIPADSITLSKSKGWLNFKTTASQLESLLKTTYHTYKSADSKKSYLGTSEYSLPQDIVPLVDLILPGTTLSEFKKNKKIKKVQKRDTPPDFHFNPNITRHCDAIVTPKCIKALYGIPNANFTPSANNKLGIFETADNVYAQEDLDQFYAAAAPYVPKGTAPEIFLVNNATAPYPIEDAGEESDMDIELAQAIIYPQTTALYQVEYRNPNDSATYDVFDDFLDVFSGPYCADHGDENEGKLCNALTPPTVISISWGGAEDPTQAPYYKRQCIEWMKLGLQGTSVFVSSGDSGVEEGQCLGHKHNRFVPGALASCPYLTAVGATVLPPGGKIGDRETSVTRYSAGGGFSNVYRTPSYQSKVVSSYLTNHHPGYESYNTSDGKLPRSGDARFNAGGRGYPDIAAVGDNGVMAFQGKVDLYGTGTSMSCPIVASMFTLINEERFKIGKGSVGFVNPGLYQAYEKGAFNDVVEGNQTNGGGCGGTIGFSATPGWDPVTGLGTPKYAHLLKFFLSL